MKNRTHCRCARTVAGVLSILTLIFIAPVATAMNLSNGGVVAAEISVSGEIDEYTFSAVAGDTVFLRIADTETTQFINAPFLPHIELIAPNGSLITSSSGALVGDIARALTVSGQYTVRARDDSGGEDETGTYNLYFAKAPGANDDGLLPNGGTVSGTIDLGDIDSYTFNANAGETVYLRVADTETTEFINSPFNPSVRLLDPSGSILTSSSGPLVGDVSRALVSSGTYTVIITDESGGEDATGSYDLYFAKAPGANDDGCIANGQSANGFIDLGDIDSYSFHANAGTSVVVSVTDLDNSSLFPSVRLLGPTGTFITSDSSSVTAQFTRTVTSSGVFTLIVTDESGGEDATGNYRINISGVSVSCPTLECNGESVTVNIANGDTPTARADVILGTSGADIINSLGGDDTICGLGGNDIINSGVGNDWVDGGNGNDDIQGRGGDDELFGGSGDDVIRGGPGDDDIEGEEGDDSLIGQGGNDIIDGGDGVDDIIGGAGSDIIYTGAGATVGSGVFVSGGGGSDTIHGGPDADDIRGRNGADTINGGSGNDIITGGEGRDTINGGAGNDNINGQAANDTLNGDAGNDTISGGSGNDTLNGGAGNDNLNGGSDLDICNGQAGTDTATNSCETKT